MEKTYGYIRVSTKDQNEDRQLIVVDENKVLKVKIHIDVQLGNGF